METRNPQEEELTREATRNPPSASVLLDCLESAGNEGDNNNEETQEGNNKGREQYLHVEVSLPASVGCHLKPSIHHSHIIVVADASGSMCGNPWEQVKAALTHIANTSLEKDNITVDIIVYSKDAEIVNFTPEDYKSVISGLRAGNTTSFIAAFNKVTDVINTGCEEVFDSTVVLFMTDGQDTVSKKSEVDNKLNEWSKKMSSQGRDTVVHSLGFRADHDLAFMKKLCGAGTVEGLFRYCESSDGAAALQNKIEELFSFAMSRSAQSVDVEVQLDGENKVVGMGKLQQSLTVQAEIVQPDETGSREEPDANPVIARAEMWVFLSDATVLPKPTITLVKHLKQDGATHEIRLPCQLSSVERHIVDDDEGKALWNLNILSRNTDVLAAKVAKIIEKKKDVANIPTRLQKLQSRLSSTRLFGKDISKELRESLIFLMKEIQEKLDRMQNMLARYSRGETSSVSILARAHDLRYEAQFSKSRRQRLMDRRVTKNIKSAKADQAALQDLVVDEGELKSLSEEAVGFFFCALSQDPVVDVMLNSEDKENAIGFGLAVKRPEFVVDDPTSIQLCLVSGTLVSRTSMLDALEFKINLSGHLQAHNGFEFYGSDSFGYATVGAGREPINAWLPLYVTKTHWERVKVLLKPSLGYFCTLDPLGFDWKQLDIPFMVLGAMIGQLSDTTVGQHQLQLLFTFQRTCAALVEDFNLKERLTGVVREFVRGPQGRLKNVISNLYTLIGYVAALPTSVTRPLLGYTGDATASASQSAVPVQLWYAVLAEILRRGGGTSFKGYNDQDLNTLTDLLLHGRGNSLILGTHSAGKAQEVQTACTVTEEQANNAATQAEKADSHFTVMCNEMAANEQADLKIGGVEPDTTDAKNGKGAEKTKAEVQLPVELRHCKKMDQAMETWAQAEVGVIKNKNQADKVAAAKKQVKHWITEGQEMAGLSDLNAQNEAAASGKEGSDFDLDAVDSSVMEITAKLLTRLSRSCFPKLSVIPGAIAFLHAWLSGQHSFSEMSDGLPPDVWIQSVKRAVTEIYGSLDGYVRQCREEVAGSAEGPEEVLVVESREEAADGAAPAGRRGQKGQGSRSGAAGADSDEDEFEDHAFLLDEDDPVKIMKRRQNEHRQLVTLPMILHALDPCQNRLRATRAMLCQAVQYGANTRARDACSNNRMLDLKDQDTADKVMRDFHAQLVSMYKNRDSYHLLWKRANFFLLRAETVWAFIGYLMNTYADRGEGVSQLLEEITALEPGNDVPCLAEKVQVLLSGKWQDHVVFARGNACIPAKDFAKKLEKVLGEEAWSQIDLTLRGSLQIHVYRESDIPNRHGHCNSNPYIPKALRLKLGLPVL